MNEFELLFGEDEQTNDPWLELQMALEREEDLVEMFNNLMYWDAEDDEF